MAQLKDLTKAELLELLQEFMEVAGGEEAEETDDATEEVVFGETSAIEPTALPEPKASQYTSATGWGAADHNGCRTYGPVNLIKEAWAASGNRYREWGAQNLDIFKNRQLIKPEEGFDSPEEELFFKKNWNANRGKAHVIRSDVGYANARVWSTFTGGGIIEKFWPWIAGSGKDPVLGCVQPFSGNAGADEAREKFEERWNDGSGEFSAERTAKQQVLRLDNVWAGFKAYKDAGGVEVTVEEQQEQFLKNNPGYRYEDRRAKGEPTNVLGVSVAEARAILEAQRKRRYG